MRRDIAEPRDAGRLCGSVWVEAFGDGVGDDGLAFFFEQCDESPLLRHQPIDLRRLPVQKLRDGGLLGERGQQKRKRTNFPSIQVILSITGREKSEVPFYLNKPIKKIALTQFFVIWLNP